MPKFVAELSSLCHEMRLSCEGTGNEINLPLKPAVPDPTSGNAILGMLRKSDNSARRETKPSHITTNEPQRTSASMDLLRQEFAASATLYPQVPGPQFNTPVIPVKSMREPPISLMDPHVVHPGSFPSQSGPPANFISPVTHPGNFFSHGGHSGIFGSQGGHPNQFISHPGNSGNFVSQEELRTILIDMVSRDQFVSEVWHRMNRLG